MRRIKWKHDRRQLFLPVAVMPSVSASNHSHSATVTALLDTGATKTGIRPDFISMLGLEKRDRAPVQTANGTRLADLYLARLGFWPADLSDDLSEKAASELPYVLDREFLIQSLLPDFPHQMLLGMDVIGMCEFRVSSDHTAELDLP
jgi:hypothetical protein